MNRKKSKYYLGTLMLKENGSEYILLEKIYNALFYSFLKYIQKLSMLSQVIYRNSKFTSIKKKSKYFIGTPMLKLKLL